MAMAENSHQYCICISRPSQTAADRAAVAHYKAAVLKDFRWNPGSNITVRFLDGDRALQDRVRKVALEWTIANLFFDFVDRHSHRLRARQRLVVLSGNHVPRH
jgi:hypothetical protein